MRVPCMEFNVGHSRDKMQDLFDRELLAFESNVVFVPTVSYTWPLTANCIDYIVMTYRVGIAPNPKLHTKLLGILLLCLLSLYYYAAL